MDLNLVRLNELRATLLKRINYAGGVTRSLNAPIIVSNSMRTTTGRVNYGRFDISLNKRLLEANPSHINQTFIHELAHLVSVEIYGIKAGRGHGRNWQNIMRLFGVKATRAHKLDVSGLKRPHTVKAFAQCSCRDAIPIKARRLAKMDSGVKYKCRNCSDYLRLK